jgi:hypothetical protein
LAAPVTLKYVDFYNLFYFNGFQKRIGAKLSPETMPEHLKRIGGTWRFRLGVPAALNPIVGKREFRVSLKTSNLKEAKQHARSSSYTFEKP